MNKFSYSVSEWNASQSYVLKWNSKNSFFVLPSNLQYIVMHSQRNVVDEDVSRELAYHHSVTHQQMIRLIKEWKFDYLTATYFILLQLKRRGQPFLLPGPRASRVYFYSAISSSIFLYVCYSLYFLIFSLSIALFSLLCQSLVTVRTAAASYYLERCVQCDQLSYYPCVLR